MSDRTIEGGCHCGAVKVRVAALPAERLQCNCSLCVKTGWTGVYFDPAEATIHGRKEDRIAYIQGDRTITLWHCRVCGIATHWTPLSAAAPADRMGVNARLFAPELWQALPVNGIDGASF